MTSGTRRALVEAATSLLDEGGVDAVTLREVALRVGISHNAPYKHFPSKEWLLAAVAVRELERRAATLAAMADRTRSPRELLRAALHDYVSWARTRPARFKLVFSRWSIDSAELGAAARAAQDRLVGLVATAQEAGALPPGDPVRLSLLLLTLAHGGADLASAGHLTWDGKISASPEQLVDDVLDFLEAAAHAERAAPNAPNRQPNHPATST